MSDEGVTPSFALGVAVGEELLAATDADGRPLGEQALPLAYAAAGVDERPCPFQDARAEADLPINMAALRQVRRHWRELLETMRALAHHHGRWRELTGHELWRVNLAGRTLPALLLADDPDALIPGPASALFKISLGYSRIIPTLLVATPALADAPILDALPAEQFFELLDEQGWLIGQRQVCAGSRQSFLATWEAMATGDAEAHAALPGYLSARCDALVTHTAAVLALQGVAIAAAREHIAWGALDEVPGWGASPGSCDTSSWPHCARQLRASNARSAELVRALPGLLPEHFYQLFHEGEAPASLTALLEALPPLEHSDTPLGEIDALLASAARPHVASICEALGAPDAPAVTPADFSTV